MDTVVPINTANSLGIDVFFVIQFSKTDRLAGVPEAEAPGGRP